MFHSEQSPCTFGTNSVTPKRESSSGGASALVFSENRFDDMLRAFGREPAGRYETPMSLRKKLRLKAIGICQDTSKKLVRSLFTPEEPQQGLYPYASLPQDIF